MKILKSCLFALIATAANPAAWAGTPDGLQLISLATERADPYATAINAYFDRYDHDATASHCENSRLNIGGVYVKKGKKGLNSEMALAGAVNKKKRQQLGLLMTKFRDKNHDRGFDAGLVYDVKDESLILYGVSADIDTKVVSSVLPITDLQNPAKVNAAICHALVNIPVLAEP